MTDYKLYKGTDTALTDITEFPVVAQRIEPVDTRHLLPKFMILAGRRAGYHNAETELWYYNPGLNHDLHRRLLLTTHRVRVLSGRKGAELRAAFETWAVANLGKRVLKTGKVLGADPEIFVQDEQGALLPAFQFLGPKKKPNHSVHAGGATNAYWDGFQAEFDTTPVSCLAFHVDCIQNGLRTVNDAAKRHKPGAKLMLSGVVPVPDELLSTAAPEHVAFGCMPSLNAYGLHGDPSPGREVPYRFAGGHIHFGTYNLTPEQHRDGVRGMDAFVGILTTALFGSFDSPIRRRYYGLPGEYRLPKHGVEYRTLSNAWLMHPAVTHLVHELARMGFDYGLSQLDALGPQGDIVDIIRATDPVRAKAHVERHKSAYMQLISSVSAFAPAPEAVMRVCMDGAESFVARPDDIEANWKLRGGWTTHSDNNHACWSRARETYSAGGKV